MPDPVRIGDCTHIQRNGVPVNCTDSELCTFLRALGAGYLATSCLDTNVSAQSKSILIASKFYQHGKKKISFPGFQFTMMRGVSTEPCGEDSLMSLPQGSHSPANHSRSPGSEAEPTTNGTCGPTPSALLARYDLDTHSWRTFQGCLFQDTWGVSLETFPNWGTIADGELSGLMMSEHRTDEKDCGFTYATPNAGDSVGSHGGGQGRSLRTDIYKIKHGIWPTPQASEATHGGPNARDKSGRPHLSSVAHGGTSTRRTYLTPKQPSGGGCARNTPGGGLRKLEDQVAMKGQLNPSWVGWLMGFPIGWTDLKDLGMPKFLEWWRKHGKD